VFPLVIGGTQHPLYEAPTVSTKTTKPLVTTAAPRLGIPFLRWYIVGNGCITNADPQAEMHIPPVEGVTRQRLDHGEDIRDGQRGPTSANNDVEYTPLGRMVRSNIQILLAKRGFM
jgi:hypothetical protein